VVAIFETCNWLESKGVGNLRPMSKGGSQKVGAATVTMTHAVHGCGILDGGQTIYGGEAAGYVLRFADGRALYFAGDTNVFSDMHLIEQLYHPELAILPIGDLFTMGTHEAGAGVQTAARAQGDPDALRNVPGAHGAAGAVGRAGDGPGDGGLGAGAGGDGGVVSGWQAEAPAPQGPKWDRRFRLSTWRSCLRRYEFRDVVDDFGATWPGLRYSASVLLPSPATKRWLSADRRAW